MRNEMVDCETDDEMVDDMVDNWSHHMIDEIRHDKMRWYKLVCGE